ncbi:alpha/beta hydrolase [Streptomyces sp. SID13031]|uniref:alpha/beta fold hydrolase n=1 Tax=Streptomyces sp. SID13031 TaxID=2706046 RepID=UPI0019429F2B
MDQRLTVAGRVLEYSVYGDPAGPPVIYHVGTPSTRWQRPGALRAVEESGVRMVVSSRPGYGGSTRQPGRTVADVVEDMTALADVLGWDQFAVGGGSGGGPHALACAALMPSRVTRCALIGSTAPPLVDGPEPSDDEADPRRDRTSWLAARGEERIRPSLEETARSIMAGIEAGAPELPPDPHSSGPPAPPARDDPDAMARLTATFVTSHDGWADDLVAIAADWGFDLADVRVPTSIRFGSADVRARKCAELLAADLPHAELTPYDGGHIPPPPAFRTMLQWLTG